ncbi:hypothetical protein [uncultured Bacteroides sp.]|uniref:hypothetical protein n=1 Tax=uncultured Bacteroides sp. TaxID=162156 RepID=UPI0025DD4C5C|nr:hypothetical protein [uncultured Bacteroides sp.]
MKQNIVIDMNNLYVQGLVKVINEFMLEEASGFLSTEMRLKSNIEKLKSVFGEERKHMVISGNAPMFTNPSAERFNLVFKS